MGTFDLSSEQVLCLPVIANPVIERYGNDIAQMQHIQEDVDRASAVMREAFLERGAIKKFEGAKNAAAIHVVDGSMVTISRGEFTTLLALAVNVSTGDEAHFLSEYAHVFAPNSDMFGALGSPIMAACEIISLAKTWEGYTLYDGSFQSLNMNLGNLFRMQEEAHELSDYTDVMDDLFNRVVLPQSYKTPAIYSQVYSDRADSIFAISKKSTSTYAFNRIKDEQNEKNGDLREALGPGWFATPKSDRLLFSSILEAGEYVGPIAFGKVESSSGKKALFGLSSNAKSANSDIELEYKKFLDNLYFTFFKPCDGVPPLRIEMLKTIPDWSPSKTFLEKHDEILGIVLDQCQTPGLLEPYGLWLADKIAKQIQAFKELYGHGNASHAPSLFRPNRSDEISY